MSTTSEIHDRFMADNNAPYLDAYCAMHENAKKLETERDELRQRVANLEYSNEQHRLQAESWRAAAAERDGLRAEFERLKAAMEDIFVNHRDAAFVKAHAAHAINQMKGDK